MLSDGAPQNGAIPAFVLWGWQVKIYFSDFFAIDPKILADYGALDVSLVNDLPLFVDPFLLFNSQKPEYQQLHHEMIKYVKFLRDKSVAGELSEGLISAWFKFPEVRQTWLGYSESGNSGRGLGKKFADALHENLTTVFRHFGDEKIAYGTHIEKLCLMRSGIGRDNISDFATNLIKGYLLEYTQHFSLEHLDGSLLGKFHVPNTSFSFRTETWETRDFVLPVFHDGDRDDFVLLTPEDMLTKDETWINSQDLLRRYDHIASSIPNDEIRAQINNYFHSVMPPPKIDPTTDKPVEPTQAEVSASVITSKAANGYQFKTGQRKWRSRTEIVLPCRLLW